jgi:hypothetical protein
MVFRHGDKPCAQHHPGRTNCHRSYRSEDKCNKRIILLLAKKTALAILCLSLKWVTWAELETDPRMSEAAARTFGRERKVSSIGLPEDLRKRYFRVDHIQQSCIN